VFASVGVHPDNADCEEPDEARLLELAAHPKVVAIGETGLDYYWHKDAPEWQRARFRTHIRAARRCAKPLIIHTRDSAADTLRLMQEEGAGEAGGVMHCFTETLEVARVPSSSASTSRSRASSASRPPNPCARWRAMCQPTACSSRPMRLTSRRCLSGARPTSLCPPCGRGGGCGPG
jgi:predicted urease superfamily metal-dependent hydrolase